ncbi:MAG TPA: MerR family transcriptional regulator [Vicinamibacterales bacterium]|jgi:DNA-binding transcriptional MerR regulator
MRSGALAKLAGVSADTLRFYERRGLLARPPRDASGYRRYPPEAIDRVRLVQHALDAGFSIEDLARILKQRDAGRAPCREVFQIATRRLRDLEERVAALTALRDRLRATLTEWERRLDATPDGKRALLLDGLAEGPAKAGRAMRRTVR